jgi:hypothetical protein
MQLPLLRKKSVQLVIAIASIAFAAFCVHDFIGMVHQTHARAVQQNFAVAVERLQNSSPGVERVETFVRDLKAIDTAYAPADVKSALRDYTEAFEQSLDALKAGRDTTLYGPVIAHAKEQLIAAVAKYE